MTPVATEVGTELSPNMSAERTVAGPESTANSASSSPRRPPAIRCSFSSTAIKPCCVAPAAGTRSDALCPAERALTLRAATTIALSADDLPPSFTDVSIAYRFGPANHDRDRCAGLSSGGQLLPPGTRRGQGDLAGAHWIGEFGRGSRHVPQRSVGHANRAGVVSATGSGARI